MARTPASIAGHPLHPMLIALPIGLWVFSFVCDLLFRWGTHAPMMDSVAFYTMLGGIVGAFLAAVPGFIDWLSFPHGSKARAIGLAHMILNLLATGMYIVNAYWRTAEPQRTLGPVVISGVTLLLLSASGWLGGTMVYKLGIAVETEAESL